MRGDIGLPTTTKPHERHGKKDGLGCGRIVMFSRWLSVKCVPVLSVGVPWQFSGSGIRGRFLAERLTLVVVEAGRRRAEGPGVPILYFTVGYELLGGGGMGCTADDILEEPPKTVEEHGAGDGCRDKENGNDDDANYLPRFARVNASLAFYGRRQDGRCRGKGGVDGGRYDSVSSRYGSRCPLM